MTSIFDVATYILSGPGRLGGHADGGGLQPIPSAEAAHGCGVAKRRASKLLGRWRITSMDLWEADYLDMLGPAHIQLDHDSGHIEFGAVQIGLDC